MSFPFEIVIGDDCSTDGSRNILVEYETRYPSYFTVIYRPENIGATKNSYDLLTRAQGKYISIFETDDYLIDPKAFQKQVYFLESNPEYEGVTHNFVIVDESGNETRDYTRKNHARSNIFTLQDFLRHGFITRLSTGVIKNFMLDNGDYSVIKEAHSIIGDLIVLSILLKRNDMYILPDCMSAYRHVVKQGGSSAASIHASNLGKSLYEHTRMFDIAEAYFNGTVCYNYMRAKDICKYISSLVRRRDGFTLSCLRYMFKRANNTTRWIILKLIIRYPMRRVFRVFGIQKDQVP